MDTRRDDIDTLRGLACVLLVALHVIGEEPAHGLGVPMNHPLEILGTLTFHLRMPLFAVLAGFVYALRPVSRGGLASFMGGKARRLVIPMAFAATLFWVMNMATGGAFSVPLAQMWEIYLFPYAQFWFIHAVILCLAAIALLDLALPRRPLAAAVIMAGAGAALFLSPAGRGFDFLSLDLTLYLVPFFAGGVVMARLPQRVMDRLVLPLAAAGAISFAIFTAATLLDPDLEHVRRAPFSLVAGLTIGLALLALKPRMSALAWIGRYSFTVYLYHLIVAKVFHRAYAIAGSPEPYTAALVGTAIAILLPIALHWAVMRAGGPLPGLALGLKPRRRGESADKANRLPPAPAATPAE